MGVDFRPPFLLTSVGHSIQCSPRRVLSNSDIVIWAMPTMAQKSNDCARTVQKSNVFIALGLALSEKQIPQIIENIGNQGRGGSY